MCMHTEHTHMSQACRYTLILAKPPQISPVLEYLPTHEKMSRTVCSTGGPGSRVRPGSEWYECYRCGYVESSSVKHILQLPIATILLRPHTLSPSPCLCMYTTGGTGEVQTQSRSQRYDPVRKKPLHAQPRCAGRLFRSRCKGKQAHCLYGDVRDVNTFE